ncbi:ABC-type transport system substrate-binding protein [Bradyrhizobium sp. LM3.2]
MRSVRALAAMAALSLLAFSTIALAGEPKQGGILRMYHRDSPGNASIHEGATYSLNVPFMPVFNNLVIYKQDVAQNSMDTIVPELAESWAWVNDNKTLTFKLRAGVKWHDGKTVHLGGRQMHLRHADGQVTAEVPAESAQELV